MQFQKALSWAQHFWLPGNAAPTIHSLECSSLMILYFSLSYSLTGGSIVGDMAPYQAFAIGGLGSVRGYGEGAVGSGRLCLVANCEYTIPLVCKIDTAYIMNFGLILIPLQNIDT